MWFQSSEKRVEARDRLNRLLSKKQVLLKYFSQLFEGSKQDISAPNFGKGLKFEVEMLRRITGMHKREKKKSLRPGIEPGFPA